MPGLSDGTGAGLRDILDAATREPTFESAANTMAVRKAQGEARRTLNALAPELAQLCLDMGAWIKCDLYPSTDPDTDGCVCNQNPSELLARLDQLGKEQE